MTFLTYISLHINSIMYFLAYKLYHVHPGI